jgi:hypothetical protein
MHALYEHVIDPFGWRTAKILQVENVALGKFALQQFALFQPFDVNYRTEWNVVVEDFSHLP